MTRSLHIVGPVARRAFLVVAGLLALARSTRAQAASVHLATGREHLQAGRLDEAVTAFAAATRADSMSAPAWNGLGAALNRVDRFAEAFAAQDRAVRLAPDQFVYRFNRGLIANELGRFREALGDFDTVLAQRPRFAPALTERGVALAALGERDAAVAEWEGALQADSTYIWPRYYRALQAIADARFMPAASDLDAIVEAHPEHAGAHLWRWVAYRRGGHPAPPLGVDRTAWPGAIAEFLDGRSTERALEEQARRARLPIDERRRVSALYFMAQRQIVEADMRGARRTLERAVALGGPATAEAIAARAELRRLNGGRS